jgi:hypothetical protein
VNKDYFPANTRVAYDGAIAGAAEVTVASDFSVSYHKHFKVVKNLKMSPPTVYILRICGSDAPHKVPRRYRDRIRRQALLRARQGRRAGMVHARPFL